MIISEIIGKGKVLQSQLLPAAVEHYSSLRETQHAEDGVWMPKQIHSDNIIVLTQRPVDGTIPEADATICNVEGQWIGIRTADCVPVLLYDPAHQVVAAVHAGWKGTVKHIVQKTIRQMKREFGTSGEDLLAVVGPSISPEAFEVGDEVVEEFVKAGRKECVISAIQMAQRSDYRLPNGHAARPHIDLWQSNIMDLMEEGVALEHIDCAAVCTYQHADVLYSARKEGIGTGRNVTAIALRGNPAAADPSLA